MKFKQKSIPGRRTKKPIKKLVTLDEIVVAKQLARVFCEPKHAKKKIDVDLVMDMAQSICCRFGFRSS